MHDTFIKSLHHKSMLIFWWHIQVTSQLHLPKLQWNKQIHEQKSNLLNISRWMEKWNCMTLGAVRCGQYLLWSVAMMQKWQQSNNNNNKFNLKERRPARVISLNYKTKGTLNSPAIFWAWACCMHCVAWKSSRPGSEGATKETKREGNTTQGNTTLKLQTCDRHDVHQAPHAAWVDVAEIVVAGEGVGQVEGGGIHLSLWPRQPLAPPLPAWPRLAV